LLFLWMWTSIKSKVPLISVPKAILPDVYKFLDIKKDSVVYDLGCGDGQALFYFANLTPKAKYIGIENGAFPLLVAKLHRLIKGKKKTNGVEIINKDFFKQDLAEATHIFMYLYPNIMDDLLSKFDTELKKGTKVVSVSFQFTLKRPVAEIDLERYGRFELARKLYIYEF